MKQEYLCSLGHFEFMQFSFRFTFKTAKIIKYNIFFKYFLKKPLRIIQLLKTILKKKQDYNPLNFIFTQTWTLLYFNDFFLFLKFTFLAQQLSSSKSLSHFIVAMKCDNISFDFVSNHFIYWEVTCCSLWRPLVSSNVLRGQHHLTYYTNEYW